MRYDDEIRYYSDLVAQLEAEWSSDQKRTAEAETSGGGQNEATDAPVASGTAAEANSPVRRPRTTAKKKQQRG